MSDKELLELAAMAVGPKVVRKVECSGVFELIGLSAVAHFRIIIGLAKKIHQ